MNRVSVGAALGEGFALMRHRPLSVLSWGLLQAVVAGVAWALYLPAYLRMFSSIATHSVGAGAGAGAAPDPALMGQVMQMQGFSLLVSLSGAVAAVVVYCAAFRAVLFPDQRRFAYMRLSMAELLLGVLGVAGYMAFIVGMVVVILPVVIVVGIFSVAHEPAIGVIIALLVSVATVVAVVYLALRLSLLGPMAVRDKTLPVSEAWAATKGHVAALFGIGACQMLALLALEIVLGLLILSLAAGAFGIGMGLNGLKAFMQHPTPPSTGQVIPWVAFGVVLMIPVSGGLVAFIAAPWARVLRDLTHSDALEAFT